MSTVLELAAITRTYRQGGAQLRVLRGVSLSLKAGEVVALVGPSGCGKSTLLQICGLLDNPDEGTVTIAGKECSRLSDGERTQMRRQHIGFVYQRHHLLPECTAEENVMMPLLLSAGDKKCEQNVRNSLERGEAAAHCGAQERGAGAYKKFAARRANELLAQVKLAERRTHRPSELSGGEQQRVAIARGLAASPSLILADEPTGNLDPETSEHVFALMVESIRSHNAAALIATHNMELAGKMDRVIRLAEINR